MEPKKQKFMLEYISNELSNIRQFVDSPKQWRNGQIDNDFFQYVIDSLDNLQMEISEVCISGKEEGWPSIDIYKEEGWPSI